MSTSTIGTDLFSRIVRGEERSWKVWEDRQHLAFLTPFPNRRGQTTVVPKTYWGGYVFAMPIRPYQSLMRATRKVARILEVAFKTPRVAMVFEGTGVPYVHAKLYPLHGRRASRSGVWSKHREFHETYEGYLTTAEGPLMSDEALGAVQQLILRAARGLTVD